MPKILAIDDTHDNLVAVTALLQTMIADCTVLTALSGEKGLDLAEAEQPDAILLDIKMPGMDGFEVCRRLKRREATKPIPVIMLTALKTETRDLVRGLESGADAYLFKPIDEYVLAAQVKTALRIRRAERALRQQNEYLDNVVREKTASLEQSEARVKALLNAPLDEAILVNRSFQIQAVNTQAAQGLGKQSQDLISAGILDLLPAEIREKWENEAHRVMDSKTPVFFENELKEKVFSHHMYPVFNSRGEVEQLAVFTRDITKERKAQIEKLKLERQLRQAQKMEAVGALAGGIAHDFNNILSAVLGYTDLALQDVRQGNMLHDHLSEVLAAGNRAKDLIKQILAISRREEPSIQPLQINPLVKEALKMLRSTIPTSIQFKENISSDPLIVKADPTQMHQVIVNLATNAMQAIHDQEGLLEISLDSIDFGEDVVHRYPDLSPGRFVRLTVSDTGRGIPPHFLEKIFEPYFTTKEVGEGTGLGLSVVHSIVKAHQGQVTVYSEPGQGTTFHVYLPLARKAAAEPGAPKPEMLPQGTERVLLVDDEQPIVKMQQQGLERLGYSVTPHTSSLEALRAFRAEPDSFDLVITDMTMPHLTGDKLAQAIKEIRPCVPVILCTGFSVKINGRSDTLNVDGLLMKPIDKTKMARTVREVLDG